MSRVWRAVTDASKQHVICGRIIRCFCNWRRFWVQYVALCPWHELIMVQLSLQKSKVDEVYCSAKPKPSKCLLVKYRETVKLHFHIERQCRPFDSATNQFCAAPHSCHSTLVLLEPTMYPEFGYAAEISWHHVSWVWLCGRDLLTLCILSLAMRPRSPDTVYPEFGYAALISITTTTMGPLLFRDHYSS